jgi:hypothetical protein
MEAILRQGQNLRLSSFSLGYGNFSDIKTVSSSLSLGSTQFFDVEHPFSIIRRFSKWYEHALFRENVFG